ncbi:MAG TPA: tetratricopeptide repeat protein [Ktedonobacterales bacterium]|nr:tetratricopeptide repeat protein [Ktedonobacterales bacterium]
MNTEQTLPFAAVLKLRRQSLGVTQQELAQRAGLSTEAISALERGINRKPHRDTVELLMTALRLETEERAAFEAAAYQLPPTGPVAEIPVSHAAPVLPAYLTRLIGREHDEAMVAHLLRRPDVRLLTLIGPAGIGKTRLAVQVAGSSAAEFRDGVHFVDLAAVRDPNTVLTMIAQTLGVHDPGSPLAADQLSASLRGKQVLFTLDNFEQVVAAAPQIAELLAAHPEVKALVTSRAALRVRGEQEYAVPPLELPDPRHILTSEGDLTRYAAIALLLQRVRAIKPAFEVTAATAPIMAHICRRLDGLPLAIELAAPLLKLLSPTALLARLEHQLSVLSGGALDLPARQRTMEHTIAWSYDLLDQEEQALFRQLGVFVGGWTLGAAEAVCSPASASRVLDGMARLIDKSLVRQIGEAAAEPRFGMLEAIREYAVQQLDASAEAAAPRRSHAAYYMALAELAAPQLTGPDQDAWLDRLAGEYDNIQAAIGWALASGEVLLGLRLAGPLLRFWYVRGHLSEGRMWLEQLLARAASIPAPELEGPRARALYTAGVLAAEQSDYRRASELAAASGALYQHLGDARWTAAALVLGGNVAKFQADYARAAQLFEDALAEFKRLGDDQFTAVALNNLGAVLIEQGDYLRATALYEESLALKRRVGDRHAIGVALQNLGDLAHRQQHHARAALLYAECLVIRREQADTGSIAQLLSNMGAVAIAQGDYAHARALLDESATLCRETGLQWALAHVSKNLGDLARDEGAYAHARSSYREGAALFHAANNTQGLADCLDGCASIYRREGRASQAIQLYSAAALLRERTTAPLPATGREDGDRDLAALRAALPAAEFAAAWEAGRATPLARLLGELEQA